MSSSRHEKFTVNADRLSPSTNMPSSTSIVLSNMRVLTRTISSNQVYRLLVFIPLGIFAGSAGWSPVLVFLLNLLAIVPLAVLLSFVTEELSANVNQSVGGLLNATFGNAPELIINTVALSLGELRIVQASMLGAVLSNLLLGLGCCFVVGGWRCDCYFNATAAQTMGSLMVVASTSLVIPAALSMAFDKSRVHSMDTAGSGDNSSAILALSRGTALVLLVLYVLYLNFQLRTHTKLFGPTAGAEGEATNNTPPPMTKTDDRGEDVDLEAEHDALSPQAAVLVLLAITITIGVCADHLLATVDGLVETLHVNKTFIGLIVLPVVGNAAEQISAITAAAKGKADLAIGVALGSSLQIAMFVTPLLVLIGWAIGQPMSLCFEAFDAIVFFVSVLVVNGLISDGESNYLEGAMMVGTCVHDLPASRLD